MSSRHFITFLLLYLELFSKTFCRPTYLLFANRKNIRLVTVGANRSNSTLVIGHLEEAHAVDFYYEGNLIFWTDIGLEMIKGLHTNGTDKTEFTVISNGVISPDGLACDWLTKKLYWTDSETNRIEVSQFNGSNRRVLFYEDLDQPRAIALSPLDGLMFWTDWGEVPKIERASMDGNPATRIVIVNDNIMWPNGLTIDYDTRSVYWADAKLKFIAVMDYDGNKMRTVVQGDLPHPFAISTLGDYIYWTDWGTYSVNYCNKNNALNRKMLVSGNSYTPMDIQVFSPLRQPSKSTPCDSNNGGCSHLCLLSSLWPHYSCACPTGVLLLNDNKTCADGARKSLLLARRVDIRRISLDTKDHTDVVLPLKNVKHAIAVDYDPIEKRIYWTDDDVRIIRRAYINGSHQEDVVKVEVYNPDGVAVDWIARYIYWTDTGTDRIEVAYLDGSLRKILVTEGLYEPRAIVVHPMEGRMYWTDWGDVPKIERAALDGTEREVIVNTSLAWPNGLAIDYESNKLYWCDAKLDKIEMSDLNGRDRRELVSEHLPHIFGFTILDDHVYWTDWMRRSIERVQKLTGQNREVILDQIPDVMGLKAISSQTITNTNPCAPSTSTCSHFCFYKPGGRHLCGCAVGFELKSDKKTCVMSEAYLLTPKKTTPEAHIPPKNTCRIDNGGCSHICSSHGSGYKCACPHGLNLSSDGKTCISPPTCSQDQFACSSSTGEAMCIPQTWRCDGVAECADKSDEANCPTPPPACLPHQFACPKSAICLEPSSVCDGSFDCPDESDEQCCGADEFRCLQPPKNCIPATIVCDGNRDCVDGSDEVIGHCQKLAEVDSNKYESNKEGFLIVFCFIVLPIFVLFVFAVKCSSKCDTNKESEVGVSEMLMNGSSSRSDRVPGTRKPPAPAPLSGPAPKSSVEVALERGKLTGASTTSSSTGRNYPKETLNPPPSPVTDLSLCSSIPQSRYSRPSNVAPPNSRRSRRNSQRRGPPPTPCSTDINEESEPYPCKTASYYKNSHPSFNYDLEIYPPPPTPRHYFSDVSLPPSPFTERSYYNPPPPPSPIN